MHWVRPVNIEHGQAIEVEARIRYRQSLQKAKLYSYEKGIYLYFEQEQRAIAEGQFAVWYIDNDLMGSGVIS